MTCHSQPLILPAASERKVEKMPHQKNSSGSTSCNTVQDIFMLMSTVAAHKLLVKSQQVEMPVFISSALTSQFTLHTCLLL